MFYVKFLEFVYIDDRESTSSLTGTYPLNPASSSPAQVSFGLELGGPQSGGSGQAPRQNRPHL